MKITMDILTATMDRAATEVLRSTDASELADRQVEAIAAMIKDMFIDETLKDAPDGVELNIVDLSELLSSLVAFGAFMVVHGGIQHGRSVAEAEIARSNITNIGAALCTEFVTSLFSEEELDEVLR